MHPRFHRFFDNYPSTLDESKAVMRASAASIDRKANSEFKSKRRPDRPPIDFFSSIKVSKVNEYLKKEGPSWELNPGPHPVITQFLQLYYSPNHAWEYITQASARDDPGMQSGRGGKRVRNMILGLLDLWDVGAIVLGREQIMSCGRNVARVNGLDTDKSTTHNRHQY
ncbi:hypothetical protein B0J17DRAFT_709059 [Rhizoctonia solani]|nr:hypothetical protein B0J17DRAFT_709059 [Rhizoctonia solani]